MLSKNYLNLFVLYVFMLMTRADDYVQKQPDFLKGCQINKPEFTKCSTESVQGLFNQLQIGISGFDAIESFDPIVLNKIKITQGNSEAINVKVELSKTKVFGFGKVIVKESKVSRKDYSWKTKIFLPKMKLVGNYALQGRILLIPLNGHGKIILEMENMNAVLYTKTILHTKGGLTFCNVTDVKVDYDITGLKANLTNLFNGIKDLEDSTNAFFNEHWKMLAEALRPVITQTIEDILLDIMQKIFNFIPASFFVLDIPTPEELYGKGS